MLLLYVFLGGFGNVLKFFGIEISSVSFLDFQTILNEAQGTYSRNKLSKPYQRSPIYPAFFVNCYHAKATKTLPKTWCLTACTAPTLEVICMAVVIGLDGTWEVGVMSWCSWWGCRLVLCKSYGILLSQFP